MDSEYNNQEINYCVDIDNIEFTVIHVINYV